MTNEIVLYLTTALVAVVGIVLTFKPFTRLKHARYVRHSTSKPVVMYCGMTVNRVRSEEFKVEWYESKQGEFKHF